MKWIVFIMVLLLNILPTYAEPIPTANQKFNLGNRFDISAKSMQIFHQQARAEFSGQVKLKTDKFEINCSEMLVFYDQDGYIDRIEFSKNVVIYYKDSRINCQKGIYYYPDKKMVLSGDPVINDGKSVVRGQVVELWLTHEKMVINRVKAKLDVKKSKKSEPKSVGDNKSKKKIPRQAGFKGQ